MGKITWETLYLTKLSKSLSKTRVFSVSERVKEAFERSDAVALEVDLHDERTSRKLHRCKNLRNGQTIRSYVPKEMYRRLQKGNVGVQDSKNVHPPSHEISP